MVILILIAFIVTCFTVDAIVQYYKKKRSYIPVSAEVINSEFNEASVSIPKGLLFDKTHTWAFMEKNGVVKIGIDDFLLHITGPLSRVKMKNPGENIQKGEAAISIIQSGKVLTINAPISGVIKSNNSVLVEDSSIVNSSPFYDGWIYTIEPSNWSRDSHFLLLSEQYKEWLKNEFSRLKDFIAIAIHKKEFAPIIYQDGGVLKENFLQDSGPEIWEEFQVKFINSSK